MVPSKSAIVSTVTLTPRADYKRSGQCFRCGSHDHRVKNCHKTSSGSGSSYGKWVIPAVNDDDSGTYDSDDDESVGDRPGLDWRNGVATGVWN
jgi:hypothetical protein